MEDTRAWIRVENTKKALQAVGAYYRNRLTLPLVGITGSVGKTTTREMVAATLYRLAGEPEMTGEALAVVETTSSVYSDADAAAVSGWAKEAMAWAVETGALQGSGNRLVPGKTATRAELAAMLLRLAPAQD